MGRRTIRGSAAREPRPAAGGTTPIMTNIGGPRKRRAAAGKRGSG
ncbi:hypothetical protein BTRA_2269 [Burkholderia thailandensis USAMRU Malaysia |nr:hypothetical protein BTQ_1608 [Burkholderia thailandensis 2002721723]AHI78107.1 hypothetical protein BTJ_747 [Burkholderia thailandensis E444]AIC85663.1 hypothetical protein BTRA_2269 [Burkholderia thailandensis USAMRU Malaysia \